MLTKAQKHFIQTQNSPEVTQYILVLRDLQKLKQGRNTKRALETMIHDYFGVEIKVSHSIEYDKAHDVLFELGAGLKQQAEVGRGGEGVVKAIRKIKPLVPYYLADAPYLRDDSPYLEAQWHVGKVLLKEFRPSKWRLKLQQKEFDALQGSGLEAYYLKRDPLPDGQQPSPMLIMPWLPGTNLAQYMRKNRGNIRLLETIPLVAQTLTRLHQKGYLHLDFKPENLLYDAPSKRMFLVDFGCAEKCNPANKISLKGTEEYMHPYLRMGKHPPCLQALDWYSLAITVLKITWCVFYNAKDFPSGIVDRIEAMTRIFRKPAAYSLKPYIAFGFKYLAASAPDLVVPDLAAELDDNGQKILQALEKQEMLQAEEEEKQPALQSLPLDDSESEARYRMAVCWTLWQQTGGCLQKEYETLKSSYDLLDHEPLLPSFFSPKEIAARQLHLLREAMEELDTLQTHYLQYPEPEQDFHAIQKILKKTRQALISEASYGNSKFFRFFHPSQDKPGNNLLQLVNRVMP